MTIVADECDDMPCRHEADAEREKAARLTAEAELRVQRDYTRIALNDLAAAKTALAEERAAREKADAEVARWKMKAEAACSCPFEARAAAAEERVAELEALLEAARHFDERTRSGDRQWPSDVAAELRRLAGEVA